MFWLRYTVGEEQVRRPLHTSDRMEAIKRAEEVRGQPLVSEKTGKKVGGKTGLDLRLEKHLAEKLNDRTFVPTSADAAKLAVKHFAADMNITDPSRNTTELLKLSYMRLNGKAQKVKDQTLPEPKSEATAQAYVARIWTFARWVGIHHDHLGKGVAVEVRRGEKFARGFLHGRAGVNLQSGQLNAKQQAFYGLKS